MVRNPYGPLAGVLWALLSVAVWSGADAGHAPAAVADSPVFRELATAYRKRVVEAKGVAVAVYRNKAGDLTRIAYRVEDGAFVYSTASMLVVRTSDGRCYTSGSATTDLVEVPPDRFVQCDHVLDGFMGEPIVRDLIENPWVIDSVQRDADGSFMIDAEFQRGNRGFRRGGPHEEANPLRPVRFVIDSRAALVERALTKDGVRQRYEFDPRSRPGLEFAVRSSWLGEERDLIELSFPPADQIEFSRRGAIKFASFIGSNASPGGDRGSEAGETRGSTSPGADTQPSGPRAAMVFVLALAAAVLVGGLLLWRRGAKA